MTEYLADEFTRMGHDVKVVTYTAETGEKTFPYEVLRAPSPMALWKAYLWCDIFVMQQISLKRIWPLFLWRKPWAVVHHGSGFQPGKLGKLKKFCCRFAHNIAVSETTKKGYGLPADVILNSYDSSRFTLKNENMRRDFVYLGKRYQSKGVHILIKAFDKFKTETGSDWRLTLIGGGGGNVDNELIDKYIEELPFKKDIVEVGFKYPKEIVEILNHHQVQIVPSVAIEAFGVVVLEGMACGCVVIGSDGDGISEAMGDAGITFRKGNVDGLCEAMVKAYHMSEADYRQQKQKMKENLERLSLHNVAERYIQAFRRYMQ